MLEMHFQIFLYLDTYECSKHGENVTNFWDVNLAEKVTSYSLSVKGFICGSNILLSWAERT